ncbi:preprotein translocase subunit SecD [Dysgonomonas hofstadii]|uniref:Preprotein translocase subunit SecD n=1 Tax=Dysgonomonas hofstadii TaxID=637886 RepID=A0A840CK81_9BACT|nr:hypothetical protein [Dysgonomonas hofstadii]MBB4036467.1 preprotein translocase subunit SecD [Dysgonomonas hofstadii]
MKSFYKYIAATILILIMNTGCPAEPKLTKSIVFELGGESGKSDSSSVIISDITKVDKTIAIIKERLHSYGIANKIERNTETNDYTLWLPEKIIDNAVKNLISTTGKIELWETWDISSQELPSPQDSVYRYIMTPRYNASFFLVNKGEMAQARQLLMSYAAEKQWPQNIKYVWGKKPAYGKGDMYELYMLRSMHPVQTPVITNEHIKKAFSEQSYGHWSIEIELNATGSSRFAKATRENIGKALAIVIDNKVYSAPTVQSAIEGGRLQIAGNFTKAEVDEYASILMYEALPLSVTIKE